MEIKYSDRSDARVLDADDLKRVGVEGFRKTMFPRGEAVEVDDAVGEMLLESPEIFGKFERVERDAPSTDEAKAAKASAKDADAAPGEAATTSDTPTTRPSGRASTRS